jgi:Sulfotransferase family
VAIRVWKRRSEETTPPAWTLGEEEYDVLCTARLAHVVPVREPLVLVSQLYRSGGTLLSQLLDGHPECHAHPHELRIGKVPNSRHWPRIDLDRPETWFETLYEKYAGKHFRSGYSKLGGKSAPAANRDVFPFLFLPGLQKRIFDQCVARIQVERERDILDCYFTSYFNAWLDNQTLYSTPKRVVTAFAPEMNLRRKSRESLFDVYPDGALVSIVREPRAWYASAKSQGGRDKNVEVGMERWRRNVELTLEANELYGDRVVALIYEELVLDTERTMRRLADRIGISMSPSLLEPTFNGRPIRANSLDRVDRHGVLADRVGAFRETLDASTVARVDELAGDLYERIRGVAASAEMA